MLNKYQEIWKIVERKLTGIGKKDYVMHSRMVTRAMEEIIDGEGGDPDILIPAAMLHDIGWVNVEEKYQFAKTSEDKKIAEQLHLKEAEPIIDEVLREVNYPGTLIEKIIYVVSNHKSKNPNGDKMIECMVDADNLSDTYQESFYSDVNSYGSTPLKTLEFRSKNTFFTKTANKIFKKHLKSRKAEIDSGEAKVLVRTS
jgi:hypothetical protein